MWELVPVSSDASDETRGKAMDDNFATLLQAILTLERRVADLETQVEKLSPPTVIGDDEPATD